jgi:hypothetical protein
VLGKVRVQPAYDEFFRCSIRFRHEVDIAFIFRGDTALEVDAEEFPRFQGNRPCACCKAKIKLTGKVLQGALLSVPLARRPRSLIVRI